MYATGDPIGQWDSASTDWEEFVLWDLAEYINGGPFKPSDFNESGLRVIKITELKYGISSTTTFYNGNIKQKYLIDKGDLLFAWSGNPETSLDAFIWRGDKAILNQHIFKVIPKDFVNKHYLYFLLKYLRPTFIRTARDKATSMGHVKVSDLKRLIARIPSLPKQRLIAGILGALDDKIELNRRMNATLESMARAVYRQWFMENEDVGSWDIGQIKNLGEIITGKTPPTNDRENYDGEILFITIPDMHGKMFVIETGKTLSEQGVQTQRNKTLPPFSICVSCIATPGLVSMTTMPAQTNQQINSLIPRDNKSYFYCYFALRELGDEIRARGSGGSVLLNLNKGQFETMDISIPPADLMHKFQEFAEPLLMRLLANEKESRTLASLRDGLLPKLMRGEVKVSDVEGKV